MTNSELDSIEQRARENDHFLVEDVYPPPIGSPLHAIAREDVPALVAEIRRAWADRDRLAQIHLAAEKDLLAEREVREAIAAGKQGEFGSGSCGPHGEPLTAQARALVETAAGERIVDALYPRTPDPIMAEWEALKAQLATGTHTAPVQWEYATYYLTGQDGLDMGRWAHAGQHGWDLVQVVEREGYPPLGYFKRRRAP